MRPAAGLVLAGACAAAACGEAPPVHLTILGTTDLHGHLVPHDYARNAPADHSLAQVATLVDSVRAVRSEVILVDSGDLLQGTALNEYQARVEADAVHPVLAALDHLEYDAAAIGNHEFNYGIPYLEARLEAAATPFLAANVFLAGTDSLAFRPYVIVERAGLRVGILGLTTPGVAVWDRANVEGRLEFGDMVEAGRRWLPRLEEEGTDVVVVVAHSGLGPGSTYGDQPGIPAENAVARLAVEVPGIDVIFAGHTREPIDGRRIGGSLVLHAGAHGAYLAVAELDVRRTSVGVEVSGDGTVIPTRGVPPSREITGLVASAHERTLAWLEEPIGYTPDAWSARTARAEDTPIADLIARVQLERTGADISAVSIFDPDAGFGPGPVTRRDILGLYVYPNTLRAVRLSGADVRAYLEHSARYYRSLPADELVNDSIPGYDFDMLAGIDYALDLERPVGERVVELRRAGRLVADTDTLTLALNSYRQSGGGGFGMVRDAAVVFRDETDVASMIAAWVGAKDTLRADEVFRRNWELRPSRVVERLTAVEGEAGRPR